MNTYLTKTLEEWINKIVYFRLIFFITLCITIFFNLHFYGKCILQEFYLILCIILGFAYWKEKWIRFILVGFIVGCRLYFDQSPILSLRFINLLITYYLSSVASSFVIMSYIKQKENTLQLTFTLAKALDSRDHYTANHSENVSRSTRYWV